VLFRCLFELIVRTFRIRELTLVLDDTLCPKWGRRIYGTSTFQPTRCASLRARLMATVGPRSKAP